MSQPHNRIETSLVHAGEPRPRPEGAVVMPIYQSSTFEFAGGDYHDVKYIRMNNTPNHRALHAKLAALENAQSALVTASGMAAITTALLTVLKTGDHLLVQASLYGGTHDFLTHDFQRMGIDYSFIDADAPNTWAAKRRPNTRAIYVETMSNPLLNVPDLGAVVAFARAHKLVSLIDNTFATPIAFRPIEHGFDLSLYSCTKYMNGHNDLVAGAVIGSADLIEQIRRRLNHLGGTLDPHACFMLHRGVKTLALRYRYQCASALQIAQFLADHPAVAQVNYPGLKSHPQHTRAAELFSGFGGMISFEPAAGTHAAARLLERLTIPAVAASLGGLESLVTRPATTSHAGLSPEERQQAGISDALIRFSVGIENPQDLIADFDNALRVWSPRRRGAMGKLRLPVLFDHRVLPDAGTRNEPFAASSPPIRPSPASPRGAIFSWE